MIGMANNINIGETMNRYIQQLGKYQDHVASVKITNPIKREKIISLESGSFNRDSQLFHHLCQYFTKIFNSEK